MPSILHISWAIHKPAQICCTVVNLRHQDPARSSPVLLALLPVTHPLCQRKNYTSSPFAVISIPNTTLLDLTCHELLTL
ncbi:hypothetical protein ABKN59_003388 [Abortiporus biennis]